MWLGLQQDVDLWDTHHARRKDYEKIKRIGSPKTA
jgi:plasmid maintenance system antidote protein VapI